MISLIHHMILTCLILLAIQPLIAGLQCYVCSSCTTASGLQNVSSDDSGYSCTKTTTMVAGKVITVSRSYTTSCSEYNYVVAGTGVIFTCCTTDGCNGTIAISYSIMLTVGVVIVVSLVKMINEENQFFYEQK